MRKRRQPSSVSDESAPLPCGAQEFCGHPQCACERGSHAFAFASVGTVDTQFHATGVGHAPLLGTTWGSRKGKGRVEDEVGLGEGRAEG